MEVKRTFIIESSTISVWTTLKFEVHKIKIELCQLSSRLCKLDIKLKIKQLIKKRMFRDFADFLDYYLQYVVCNNIIT